jgi:hypothetical protein
VNSSLQPLKTIHENHEISPMNFNRQDASKVEVFQLPAEKSLA